MRKELVSTLEDGHCLDLTKTSREIDRPWFENRFDLFLLTVQTKMFKLFAR